jgi:hypothetical protein
VGYINDPWVNGVLLSEIVAAMFAENRALIKQVLCLLFTGAFLVSVRSCSRVN